MVALVATMIPRSPLVTTGLVFSGVVAGGWLTMRPHHIISFFDLEDEDGWSLLIVQIMGQLLLGMVVIPIWFEIMQWLYF